MTPERWQQVERICQLVLDEAPDGRLALLDRECAGDRDLRREVESLLGGQDEADRLLEIPAWQRAPGAADAHSSTRPPRFGPGARLGPFEVGALVAAGGMGEVYRARDTRLGRTVALKVLPGDAAADPDWRRRMEAEAHAVSRLNHPNICALFDIGFGRRHRLPRHGVPSKARLWLRACRAAGRRARRPRRDCPSTRRWSTGPKLRTGWPPPTVPASSTATSSRAT